MPPAPRERRSNVRIAPVARKTSRVTSVISLNRALPGVLEPSGAPPSSQSTALQPRKAIAANACSHRRMTSNASAGPGAAGTLELGQELIQVGGGQRVPLADQLAVGGDEVGLGHAAHAVLDRDRPGIARAIRVADAVLAHERLGIRVNVFDVHADEGELVAAALGGSLEQGRLVG